MTALLSESDLQGYGDLLSGILLTDTCTIYRNPDQAVGTRTPDGQGGYTDPSSFTVVGWTAEASVPCAVIADTRGVEPFMQAQLQTKSSKVILLPRKTAVLDSDRLSVANTVNGVTTTTLYEVTSLGDPATYEILRRVYVERQGQGAN